MTFGFGRVAEELRNGRRKHQQARGEDRRNDARHVELERQVRALALHHAPAHLALGVVHLDLALRALDEHAEQRNQHDHDEDQQHDQRIHFAGAHHFQGIADGARQARDDAGDDDHGDAVADAAFGDLLAEPHDEDGAGGDRHGRDEQELRSRIRHQVAARILDRERRAEALESRQKHRAVARVLHQFAPAGLAVLADLRPRRIHHRGHLHDDRRGDVGHHVQGEDAEALQRAAREHVEHAEQRALLRREESGEARRIDARNRNERADAVDHERAQQEPETLAHLGEARHVSECRCGVGARCGHCGSLGLETAAGRLDGALRALRRGDGRVLDDIGLGHRARQDDLDALGVLRHQVRRDQRLDA